ncbi:hypothetical protein RvY_05225 [Ramazzottius varieornatus]|uniref:Uncharacterized protein n=1 Tax=Ramazzottius varieornatus TaxID=947166 RepID=A0A1D1UUE0_RAMVA|nr:hypothetical protein RvY_05225 [Ramazzottius varieornatus]
MGRYLLSSSDDSLVLVSEVSEFTEEVAANGNDEFDVEALDKLGETDEDSEMVELPSPAMSDCKSMEGST